jgi:hypothetical protein
MLSGTGVTTDLLCGLPVSDERQGALDHEEADFKYISAEREGDTRRIEAPRRSLVQKSDVVRQ